VGKQGANIVGGRTGRTSKLLGLEIVRFLCALTILVFHANHFTAIGDNVISLTELPLYSLLWPIYEFGKFGVQIFWCISGYIFYWKYADVLAARQIDGSRFFWLRFSRLYPLHFATLLIVAALQPIYMSLAGHAFLTTAPNLTDFVLHLGMADQWWGMRDISFNAPIWSVSAEIFVYVAFFMLLRSFGKSPWLVVGAILAALACFWFMIGSPALACAGYFFAGGAAAEASRLVGRKGSIDLRWGAALLVLALFALGTTLDLRDEQRILPTFLLAIVPPILLLAAQDWPILDRWEKSIQVAGNLTYSTYLLHFPMQLAFAIVVLFAGITLPVGEVWFLLAYLRVTLELGRIGFVRFELPAQNLIRRLAFSQAPKAAAA
jgi:peptidoglycan/LPS O-acetylase OafA/YrhL